MILILTFTFISSINSRAVLPVTRKMMLRILTYHQVTPAYIDFVSDSFGQDLTLRNLRFGSFREQTLIPAARPSLATPEMGRSGRQIQVCYNLRSVALRPGETSNLRHLEWSIRQAATYHQIDVVEGTTVGIMIQSGVRDLKEHVQELTGKNSRPEDRAFHTVADAFKSSLTVHLMCWRVATEEWRWYTQWLEKIIDDEMVVNTRITNFLNTW